MRTFRKTICHIMRWDSILLFLLVSHVFSGLAQDSLSKVENQIFRKHWIESRRQSENSYPFTDEDFQDAVNFHLYRESALKAYNESFFLVNHRYLKKLSGEEPEKFNFHGAIFGDIKDCFKYLPQEVLYLNKIDSFSITNLPLYANKIKALILSDLFFTSNSSETIRMTLKQFKQLKFLQIGRYGSQFIPSQNLLNALELNNLQNLDYLYVNSLDFSSLRWIDEHLTQLKSLYIDYLKNQAGENFPVLHNTSLNYLRFTYKGNLNGSELNGLTALKTLVLINESYSNDSLAMMEQLKHATSDSFRIENQSLEYIGISLGYHIQTAEFSNLSNLKQLNFSFEGTKVIFDKMPNLEELSCIFHKKASIIHKGSCNSLKFMELMGDSFVFSLEENLPRASVLNIWAQNGIELPLFERMNQSYVTLIEKGTVNTLKTAFYRDSMANKKFFNFKKEWEEYVKLDFPFERSDFTDLDAFETYSNEVLNAFIRSEFLINHNWYKCENTSEIPARIEDFLHLKKRNFAYKPEEVFFLSNYGIEALENELLFAPKIKALVIDIMQMSLKDTLKWKKTVSLLRQFKNLEYLEISNHYQNSSFYSSFDLNLMNKILETLKMEGLCYFTSQIANLETLEILNRNCMKLKGLMLQEINGEEGAINEQFPSNFLEKCPLEFLYLVGSFPKIPIPFNKYSNLEALLCYTSGNNFDSNAVQLIQDDLNQLQHLKLLYLNSNLKSLHLYDLPLEIIVFHNSEDEQAITTKVTCENLPNLISLNVSGNKIQASLKQLPNLQQVYLYAMDSYLSIKLWGKTAKLEELYLEGQSIKLDAKRKVPKTVKIELRYRESYSTNRKRTFKKANIIKTKP